MEALSLEHESPQAEERVPSPNVRYVARQPILDLQGKVHGYELLFRNGPESGFCGDGDSASRTMIDNTVLFGLNRLTGSLPAFVNCTTEILTGDVVQILPSGMTILEVLESVEPTSEVIAACRRLKAMGYRLALDDFRWKPSLEPLLHIADYVKVDFLVSDAPERRDILNRIKDSNVALIAEKIETHEQFAVARREGFTLLQGYFFCRPLLLENRKVPANRLSLIEILGALQNEELDLASLSPIVQRDTSLTYRLLRLVNSPLSAVRQEVRNIQGAMLAVGEETFRRLAMLAVASELNAGQPLELLRMAFLRARFCELAAHANGLDGHEQYLLGLLSLLPAMLRIPMQDAIAVLPLRAEIRGALLGERLPERCLLCWLEAHESAHWSTCDRIARVCGLSSSALQRSYEQAALWAAAVI